MKHTMKTLLLCLAIICLTIIPITAKADGLVPVPSSSDTFKWLGTLTEITDGVIKYAYIPKDENNGWSKNLLVYYINTGNINVNIAYHPDDGIWYAPLMSRPVNIDDLAAKNESDINSDYIGNLYPYFWVDEIPTHTDAATPSPSAPHTHKWLYGIIYEAAEDTDGLEGEYCLCGATKNTSIIPAGDIIISNNYAKIDAAKSGQNIVLDMKTMCNLSQTFMKKLASKNNCSFTIRLKYLNKLYEFYIPAGASFDTDLEYYGPEKLMEMFE